MTDNCDNNAVHAEDGVARLQMENQLAVPGDGRRYTADQVGNTSMPTHVLMMNLRGSSWDFIPDDLWSHIVQRFVAKTCDGVSFDSVTQASDISRLGVFADHVPEFVRHSTYRPTSIPASVPNPDKYEHSVAVFRFDEWIASLLLKQPVNSWCAGNDGTDADELVFWCGDRMKLLAVPYEGQAYFDNLTNEEKQLLLSSDPRIDANLHAV
ncbi:MAG: hypothetical protein AAFN70_20720 [Planctomycetota bacterium]